MNAQQCRVVRNWLGWDQSTLAQRAGVGRNTVSLFENGHGSPREATLRAIKSAFADMGVFVRSGGIALHEDRASKLLGFDGALEILKNDTQDSGAIIHG